MFKSLNQSFIYFLECVFVVLILSILMIACWRNTNSIEITDPKDLQEYIPKEDRATKEALVKRMVDSKPLSKKYKIKLTDYLDLTTQQGIDIAIPEEHIHDVVINAEGKAESLILDFYLPYMDSKKYIEARFALADKNILEEILSTFRIRTVVTNVEKTADPVFFKVASQDFQKSSNSSKNQSDTIQSLKNGKYDAKLNLVAYSGKKEIPWNDGSTTSIHTIYLKLTEDINNPEEWIMYGDEICLHCWIVGEYYIEAIFIPSFLPIHDVIQARINAKLEEFTQYTPFQNIKKGIINFGDLMYKLVSRSFKRVV